MPVDSFVLGDWNAICDQCGRKAKASTMTRRWDGLMVHRDPSFGCFETRHPQDFVRVKPDDISVPWTRPEVADVFVRTAAQEVNCSTADFNYVARGSFDAGDFTIVKTRIPGPVTVTGTITVLCTLEIR